MEYPEGFPDRLKPRLEASVLRLKHKYPLVGNFQKKLLETFLEFSAIACKAVENGEWTLELAHAGSKHFIFEIAKDQAISTHPSDSWAHGEFERYVSQIMNGLTNSVEWLGHLDRLAKLAEKPSENPKGKNDPQGPLSTAEARQQFVNLILVEKGWSILDWAKQANVAYHTAADYLSGDKRSYQSTRTKLAKALGIPVDQLPR